MNNSAKTKNRSLFLLALLMLICSLPALATEQAYAKKKEINKTFNVSMSDLVQVDNRYGNITVAYWDKKEAAFRIVIESKANNESKAQAELERVNIQLQKSGSVISAITSLTSNGSNWNFGGGSSSLTIQYYINIPNGLNMDLSQKYGNIDLPASNNGKCNLHVKYGNLSGGNFKAELNIEAKYSNVKVGNVDKAELEVGYAGNVVIGNANDLKIDSKYSNLTMQDVKTLSVEKKYGNLNAQNVGSFFLDMKYSEATLQSLAHELSVEDISYSSLNIKALSASFSEVNIEARYSTLTLGLSTKAAFKVSADDMNDYDIKGFNITSSEREDKKDYRTVVNNGGQRCININGGGYSNLKIKAY